MSAKERMAAYDKGLGSMSAEERMAASEKGYENGLGATSAEERMAATAIVWEEKYAEFESYDGMPEIGTLLYTWQNCQLSNTHASCLNAKIRKEMEENEGSTIWSERRVKLANCVEQKRHELSDCVEQNNRSKMAKMGIAWEEKYAEFESYDEMPEKGTPLYTLKNRQLSNGAASLNAKIRREMEENIGSIWSERRVKLANCVEQKRHE